MMAGIAVVDAQQVSGFVASETVVYSSAGPLMMDQGSYSGCSAGEWCCGLRDSHYSKALDDEMGSFSGCSVGQWCCGFRDSHVWLSWAPGPGCMTTSQLIYHQGSRKSASLVQLSPDALTSQTG